MPVGIDDAALAGIGLLFNAGLTLFGADKEAKAREAQAAFNRQQSMHNAALDEILATEAERQGQEGEFQILKEGEKVLGAQRTAYAGQGVKVDTGSAADVAKETRFNIARDVLTMKNNAWKAAWGYRVQASNERLAAKYGQRAGQNIADSTILTGGLKALGQGAMGGAMIGFGLKNYKGSSGSGSGNDFSGSGWAESLA